MQLSNAANRLDRLPISRFHKITLVAISFAYFFEFADINTFAVTVPKLIKLWGVTVNQIAYVTSLSFVGMFIGSLVASWLTDRWGRKKALVGTTLWFALFSFATVFSWDILSLGVFRILTSAGLAAMTVVAVVYLNEMFPAAVRGKYQAYALVIGICGTPVTNLIAAAVVPLTDWSWRLVYLWGSLGILLLLFIRSLKESPRWYESKGEYDKADAVLTEIETRVAAEKGPLTEPGPPVAVATQTKAPLSLLLQKKYLAPTILLSVVWVTQTIGFFGYSSWAPTLLVQARPQRGKGDLLRRAHNGRGTAGLLPRLPDHRPLRTQVVPGRLRHDYRDQRALLRTHLQPDPDRRVRLPRELLRARLHGRSPTPTPRRSSTPVPGRWAPASPTDWAGCPTPPGR